MRYGETEHCGEHRFHDIEEVQQGEWTISICKRCEQICERRRSWCAWKAAMLNRLFLEQGKMGKGKITGADVRYGENTRSRA
jgi:hypothetical protein